MAKKKKAGRPRKVSPRLRANAISVTPTVEEREMWTRAAELADRSRADWMRIACNEAAEKLFQKK